MDNRANMRSKASMAPNKANMASNRANMERLKDSMAPNKVSMGPHKVNMEHHRANMDHHRANMDRHRANMEPHKVNMALLKAPRTELMDNRPVASMVPPKVKFSISRQVIQINNLRENTLTLPQLEDRRLTHRVGLTKILHIR